MSRMLANARARRLVAAGLVAASLAVFSIALLARLSGTTVWDDAFIAVRYAANFAREGRLAWNPGGEPTFGLTSPLVLLVVGPLQWLFPGEPVWVAQASSLVGGLLALAPVLALVAVATRETPAARGPAFVMTALALGVASPRLADHLASGMDTAFAVAWAAALLLLFLRHEPAAAPVSGGTVVTAVVGGLSFFARPELLLFALSIPAARAIGRRPGPGQRRAVGLLALTALVLVAALALAAGYFGSALPLPFHAKGTGLYGSHSHERYAGVGARELGAYLRTHLLLLAPIAAGLLLDARHGWRRTTSAERGLLASTAAFCAYHALFVLPVMHYSQRFYYPTLPALLYLAARGVTTCTALAPGTRWLRAAAWSLCAAGVLGLGVRGASAWNAWRETVTRGAFAQYDPAEVGRLAGWDRHWPGLAGFSRLPDDLSIATTEVGYPAALNPRKRILDLAGLNETALALGSTTPADWIARERPDVMYLPNPDYREMTRAIEGHPALIRDYERQDVEGGLRVALRRDSPHWPAMRAALAASAGR